SDAVERSHLTVPLQLAESGIDVAPARLADETRRRAADDGLKRKHSLWGRSLERNPWTGIQGDEVHLTVQVSQQLDYAPRVGVAIVDPFQQRVLERQPLPRTQRILLARLHQIREMILARDRHQLLPLLLGRCVD